MQVKGAIQAEPDEKAVAIAQLNLMLADPFFLPLLLRN